MHKMMIDYFHISDSDQNNKDHSRTFFNCNSQTQIMTQLRDLNKNIMVQPIVIADANPFEPGGIDNTITSFPYLVNHS